MALALCFASPAGAHDFWVQPQRILAEDAGHDADNTHGGPWRLPAAVDPRRIVRFEAIAPDGTTIDLRGNLHPGGSADDGEVGFRRSGAYVMVLETDDRAQSNLPAMRQRLYLPLVAEYRQFHKFIILTMMLLFAHDSAIGWEEV